MKKIKMKKIQKWKKKSFEKAYITNKFLNLLVTLLVKLFYTFCL